MFCRFCGKAISDDSEYCSFCGEALTLNKAANEETSKESSSFKKPFYEKLELYTLERISSICFWGGLIGFLLLFIGMSPGIGSERLFSYLLFAAIAIGAAIYIHRVRNEEYTHKREFIALVFGLSLIIPTLALRLVYEIKVDAATADIPQTGYVCLNVKLDEEFYSRYNEGLVRNPYSYIEIDGKKIENSTIKVQLNKEYFTQIGAGYESSTSSYGTRSSGASGTSTKRITFTQSNLLEGYTIKDDVSLSSGHAKVTVTFERVCPFWEVIFYFPS